MDAILAISTSQAGGDPGSAEEFNKLILEKIHEGLEALKAFELPELEENILPYLTDMHIMAGVLLAVVGALYLLMGWRIFKVLLITNAAVFGAMFGGMLAVHLDLEDQWWIGFFTCGLVMAILAWPLMRVFLGLCGAVLGAGAGFFLFKNIAIAAGQEDLASFAWAGSVAGGILLFVVIFVKFKFCVLAMTALQGSVMLVNGLLCLALKNETSETYLLDLIRENTILYPLGLFIVTLAGLVIQLSQSAKFRKKSKPPPKPTT